MTEEKTKFPETQKHSQNYRFSLPDQPSCLWQRIRANTLQQYQVKTKRIFFSACFRWSRKQDSLLVNISLTLSCCGSHRNAINLREATNNEVTAASLKFSVHTNTISLTETIFGYSSPPSKEKVLLQICGKIFLDFFSCFAKDLNWYGSRLANLSCCSPFLLPCGGLEQGILFKGTPRSQPTSQQLLSCGWRNCLSLGLMFSL